MASEKNNREYKAEILAPAGSFESVAAAVRCSANAVYLGAKSFSARAGAQNFDSDELLKTVCYCHERDVKVHLALNTSLYDSELCDAARLIEYSAKIGVDVLIVSDLGVLSLAKEICPDLSLHASTQMGIASVSGAKEAFDLGFSRAVLARELNRNEIREIAEANVIETEVFVHGAHCMSISGQCYLSAVLGKRSGNRGRCAQPCRLKFGVKNCNDYALSLKDLSLYNHIQELCKYGVTSFKIEGRMKRPEYVAAAVSLIRAAMLGEDTDEIFSLSRDLFSRSGFTDGYYCSKIGKNMFGYRTRQDVQAMSKAIPRLHELYRRERQCVALDAEFKIDQKAEATLCLSDKNGNNVSVKAQASKKTDNPASRQFVFNQINRLGSTPYFIENFSCELENGAGISPTVLNSLRREAVEKLSAQRQAIRERKIFKPSELVSPIRKDNGQRIASRFETAEQFKQNHHLCECVFLPVRLCLELLNDGKIEDSLSKKIIAELDRWMFSNDVFTDNALNQLKKAGINSVCVQNIGQLLLAKEKQMQICFGAFMNVYNSRALKLLSELSVDSAIASFEISSAKLSQLSPFVKIGALVYGYIPLMLTRACPVKSASDCKSCKGRSQLVDRKGKCFRVACRGAVSEIYNSAVLSAEIESLDFDRVDFLLAYFTNESPDRCTQVIKSIKNRISVSCDGEFTRGLYRSGVI